MFIVILTFLWPAEMPDLFCFRGGCGVKKAKHRAPLVTWDSIVKKVPWGLILLLGGGFALADAITVGSYTLLQCLMIFLHSRPTHICKLNLKHEHLYSCVCITDQERRSYATYFKACTTPDVTWLPLLLSFIVLFLCTLFVGIWTIKSHRRKFEFL